MTKLISILLALCLLTVFVGTLASCDNGTPDSPEVTTDESTVTDETTVPNAPESTKEPEAGTTEALEESDTKPAETTVDVSNVDAKYGLYETGSDYTVQIKTWNDLVREGVLTAQGKIVVGKEAELAGDLMLPDALVNIPSLAFEGCTSLTSVVIPDGVKSIGNHAFSRCKALTSVSLGESVAHIGDYAFYNCAKLDGIDLPESLKTVGKYAFYGCSGFTSLTIPDGVTSIDEYAFYGCEKIESIVFGDGLTVIAPYSFGYCVSLKSIHFRISVKTIGKAFLACTSVTDITYDGTKDEWNDLSKELHWNDFFVSNKYVVHCTDEDIVDDWKPDKKPED